MYTNSKVLKVISKTKLDLGIRRYLDKQEITNHHERWRYRDRIYARLRKHGIYPRGAYANN